MCVCRKARTKEGLARIYTYIIAGNRNGTRYREPSSGNPYPRPFFPFELILVRPGAFGKGVSCGKAL